MKIKTIIIFAIFLIGCSSTEEIISYEPNIRLAKINDQIKNENYLEALEDLKSMRLEYPASNFADTVQFLIAECRFFREEYLLAASEYEQLINEMPQSNFAEQSKLKKSISFYKISPKSSLDQKFTINAIDGFQNYLEVTKNDAEKTNAENYIAELNDKLASKIFKNAKIYSKMNFLKAASIYYDLVLEKFPDSKYSEESMYNKILILKKRNLTEQLIKTSDNFFEKYPKSEYLSEINNLLK